MNRLQAADTAQPRWRMLSVSGATLALLAAVCCWGLAIPLSKGLLADIDPTTLIFVQLSASVVALSCVALATRARLERPRPGTLLAYICIGALEPGLAYYLEFIGLQRTTALHAALILTLEPIGILVLNIALFRYRRDAQLILAALMASAGVLIVMLASAAEGGAASLAGDFIIFAGTMAASLYVSLSTQLFKSGSVIALLLMQQCCSLAFVAVAIGVRMLLGHVPSWPPGHVALSAAAIGVLQFTLAFLFYFYGARMSSGYWGVVVLNLAPVFGIVASVVLLGETPSPLYFAGGALCLGSSLYTRLREYLLERESVTERL
jgi:drug/metabolite transporter (DMT)-like permease